MKRAGITYNLKKSYPVPEDAPKDIWAEFDEEETVDAIAEALAEIGFEVEKVGDGESLFRQLNRKVPPFDFVFNIAEGLRGESREAQVPALLDLLGIPYSGSGVFSLSVTLNKAATKALLVHHGIPTAPFQVFRRMEELKDFRLSFPVFVKPNLEGSSKGIDARSFVTSRKGLEEKVEEILFRYRQEALVEEFLEGMEVTAGLLGNGEDNVLGLMGIEVLGDEPGYTLKVKANYRELSRYRFPPALPKETLEKIGWIARSAFRILRCSDFARVDTKCDREGNPYLLEINPLAGLHPVNSDIVLIARAYGKSYQDLIKGIVSSAIKRYGLNWQL